MRLTAVLLLLALLLPAQTSPTHARRAARLAIRNAMVIEGNGTPAAGPKDIIIENNVITQVIPLDPVMVARGGGASRVAADTEIDASGKYVMPGLINLHGHTQDERGGVPMPVEYCLKLWLSCGITTVRDVGSDTAKTLALRAKSAKGEIAAPRLYVYPMFNRAPAPTNAEEARLRIREFKAMGADGVKFLGVYRDLFEAASAEADKLGLRRAHHVGVEETNALDDIRLGTTSIEHWYGIPDAALEDGVQHFPSNYNYNNETDRFRYAGRLWREANWPQLLKVLDGMAAKHVAWVPTLDIYEASRDLQRAQTQPQFKEYLHPVLEAYFKPNPANHGSYFFGWSSTDETYWKENYRIWMTALREFEKRGGLIGTGEDSGFIYQMYGFGLLRELELQQEAGFPTVKVLQHATQNGAKVLGQAERLGRVRAGYVADLLVVNGNPLENLKVLNPLGVDEVRDGKAVRGGGVEWTIKDGIPYHAPTLLKEVAEIVQQARGLQSGTPGKK